MPSVSAIRGWRRCERGDVVVLVAVVEHAERPVPLARLPLAGKQLADLALREIEAGKQLPPDLMQPLQPRRQLGGRLQTVIRRHQKMIGANLPAVFGRACVLAAASSAAIQPAFGSQTLPASTIRLANGVSHWPSCCS